MQPSTGNILAMASYPSFDLNKPFEPINSDTKDKWEKMTSKEKSNYLWRNR